MGGKSTKPIPLHEILSTKYGRLKPTAEIKRTGRGRRFSASCDCGAMIDVDLASLRSGNTRSCGCLANELSSKRKSALAHGEAASQSPEYISWKAMRGRCNNPNHHAYERYAGRGITVCDRWDDYDNFLEDMGRRPDLSYTLDRIDNDKGYSPENCRWATKREQILNSRTSRKLTFRGETLGVKEMAEKYGMSHQTMIYRMKKGMTLEEALTTPVKSPKARSTPASIT